MYSHVGNNTRLGLECDYRGHPDRPNDSHDPENDGMEITMRKIAIFLVIGTVLAILAGMCGCAGWYGVRQESKGGNIPTVKTTVQGRGSVIPWATAPPKPQIQPGYAESSESATGAFDWAEIAGGSGLWILYPIGAAAFLAGIAIVFFLKSYKTGIALIAGGMGLILAARFLENTVIVWILFMVLLVGGMVWLIFATRAGKKVREMLGFERKKVDQTIIGIQRAKSSILNGEKDGLISALQGAQDRDVQEAIKRRKAELTT